MSQNTGLLTRAYGTIRSMLGARGVPGTTEDFAELSASDLVARAGDELVFHVDLPRCRHRLVFNCHPRFKLADVRRLVDPQPAEAHIDVVLLVVSDAEGPTTAAKKSIDEIGRDIEIWKMPELQFDLTKHVDVPLHLPIRDEAAIREIVEAYRVKSRHQLQCIQSTDPVARYLALKPGQLVRIERASESCGVFSTCYRCCV